jgi:putative transposase
MDTFRKVVNDTTKIGLENNAYSLKRLCSLSYEKLRYRYKSDHLPSYYYLNAISKAAGMLASRKKSISRKIPTKDPLLRKPLLVSCYRFRITREKELEFSVDVIKKIKIRIPLKRHILREIERCSKDNIRVRSFTITPESLSLSLRKEVPFHYLAKRFMGVDRNASNITYGDERKSIRFSLKKVEEISRATRQIVRSFKRNDWRIRRELYAKYGRRRSERVKQILHKVSKMIVEDAKQNEAAIVLEDITGLTNLYRKGSFQGKNFRARMNSVPWYEIKRQTEYKADWDGVPVIQLTKGETRGTSKFCPVCGERLQEDRYSKVHYRELWCGRCGKWRDRDVVAVMNISHRGWLRFVQSKEEAGEAMVQEPYKDEVILKVDASKLSNCRKDLRVLSSFNAPGSF